MKKLLFILAIGGFFFSCGGSSPKQEDGKKQNGNEKGETLVNDLMQERISGNVDSIRQRVYWALEKFGRMDKGKLQNLPVHDFLKVYDEKGFLIEETHYDVNDKVVNSKKITYNDNHLILKEELFKGDKLDETVVYTYNDKKQLVKKEKFNAADKIKEWNEYIYYPETGLLQDEDLYKDNGTLVTKHVYIYNGDKLIEKQKYWGGGSPAQKDYFNYNFDGELTEVMVEKYENRVAMPTTRTTYEDYNSFGDYLLKTSFNKDGKEDAITRYAYDKYGNLAEYINQNIKTEIKTIVATTMSIEEDDLDEEATINEGEGYYEEVEEEVVTTTQSGNAYTYEYDDQNNWVQKITYKINDTDAPEERTRQFYYERIISYR